MGIIDFEIDAAAAADYRARGWWRDETIYDDFAAVVAAQPDKVAIAGHRAGSGMDVVSYRMLSRYVDRFAGALIERGVAPGDVVSLQLPNWWQFAALHLACCRIGAVTNPILPILRRREVGFILERTQSRVFVCPSVFRGFAHGAMAVEIKAATPTLQHVLVLGGDPSDGAEGFADAFEQERWERKHGPDEFERRRAGADTAGQVQFTSGTTGEPKGVVHTYNTLFLSVRAAPEALGVVPTDVMLMASPLAHNTGFMYGMSLPLMTGMKTVLQDVWHPATALELIDDEGVTVTMGSTTFLVDLCAAVERSDADISSLRLFICGGAPVPPPVVERARSVLGAEIVTCWGMTENGIATTTRPGDPLEKVTGTDGRPLPWAELKIVDATGEEVPRGMEGRLLIKAANEHVMYLGRPDLYEAAFTDGWFDTGDLARMDDDGYIRITGRTKDVIIRGGENVPALEVEAALLQHPAVADVAVVGAPHERMGEYACAVVVPVNSSEPPSLADLTAHLEAMGMTRTYWPERLELRRELPRTASGKVQKFVLRQALRAVGDGGEA
jgi:cyclohexanecarboxylate-CoA ligase